MNRLLALFLSLLGAAPLSSQGSDEAVAAVRARHRSLTGEATAFRAAGRVLGHPFEFDVSRAGAGWEVRPTPGGPPPPLNTGEMVRLALGTVLGLGEALVRADSVEVVGRDSLRGRPVVVLRMKGPPPMARGRVEDARLEVDAEDHTLRAFRMSGTASDRHGVRPMRMELEYDAYTDFDGVRLPSWIRVTLVGAAPLEDEAQRMQLRASLEVGRAALATASPGERARLEVLATLLDGLLNHDRVVAEARIESVRR